MSAAGMAPGDVIRVSVPATTGYVGVLRTLAAGVATRLDLDLDHVEDIRLAVSEACAVVLPAAPPGALLTMAVRVGDRALAVEASSPTSAPSPPGPDSFAWTVLRALADEVVGDLADGVMTIRMEFSDDQSAAPGWTAEADRL